MTLEEYGEMYVKGSGSSSPGKPEVPTSEDNENRYLKYDVHVDVAELGLN